MVRVFLVRANIGRSVPRRSSTVAMIFRRTDKWFEEEKDEEKKDCKVLLRPITDIGSLTSPRALGKNVHINSVVPSSSFPPAWPVNCWQSLVHFRLHTRRCSKICDRIRQKIHLRIGSDAKCHSK